MTNRRKLAVIIQGLGLVIILVGIPNVHFEFTTKWLSVGGIALYAAGHCLRDKCSE